MTHPAFTHTEHRPWPLPRSPWLLSMRWTDLAFLHWQVPADALRRHVPAGLELDLYEGDAWLGIVPFRMERVRIRGLPPIPTASTFPELNVRTYVRAGGRAGVWFFSLDAGSRLAVLGARAALNLPYFRAGMHITHDNGVIVYDSRREHRGAPAASFRARYEPVDVAIHPIRGTLEHWLTERYCLFGRTRAGRLYFLDIHHSPWPLQVARAGIELNTMAEGIDMPVHDEPLVHFSQRQDVVAWAPKWV